MSKSGGGLKKWDLYKKIPVDLTESTSHGSILSALTIVFMGILLVVELSSFFYTNVASHVILDVNKESKIRINFNVTMLDIPCEYATVDVIDFIGVNQQNVTTHIDRWSFDGNGGKIFKGRNLEQPEVKTDHHTLPSLEELHANGEHAEPVDTKTFHQYMKDHKYVFANFYAPWCVWCQRLHPTWEAFAEKLEEEKFEIKVVKIDCVENKDLCFQQQIRAFPTLRLYRDAEVVPPDYREDRTVEALKAHVEKTLDLHAHLDDPEKSKKMSAVEKGEKNKELQEHKAKGEMKEIKGGCQLAGFLLVNRVPGNFHIEARSKSHNINPTLTNVSHIVHDLTFGPPMTRDYRKQLKRLPREFRQLTSPLSNSAHTVDAKHQAPHHYMKVVSNHYEASNGILGGKSMVLQYQLVAQTQTMTYSEDDVPEAKFNYDISPMAVVISSKSKKWYEFITSLFAIIGGTFTVLSIIDSILYKIFKPKRL